MLTTDTAAPTRGFFTLAQNSGETDYVRMAYALALSLHASQRTVKNLSIGITPGTVVPEKYVWAFDNIIEIPWGDHAANSTWKLENEWKAIHMSPYDETIKLDADMLFFNDIGIWWDSLRTDDFTICNQVLTYRTEVITDDYYRKTFTANNLPNVYTAFMYFKKTDRCFDIFGLAKMIYFNWETFFEQFLLPEHRPTYPSTDLIFALAIKILELDNAFYIPSCMPTFTHMKTKLQGWQYVNNEDWQASLPVFFTPDLQCRLGNHLQFFPLHYHSKNFITDNMLDYYERRIRT